MRRGAAAGDVSQTAGAGSGRGPEINGARGVGDTHQDGDRGRGMVGGGNGRTWVQIGGTASVGVSLDRAVQQPVHCLIAWCRRLHTPPHGCPVLDMLHVRQDALSLLDAALC